MTHTLQAIAWTLIHFCWQAAAIAGLYALANRMAARRSSQVRYLAALGALLAMVVMAVATFAWQMAPESHGTAGSMTQLASDFPRIAEPGFVSSAAHEAMAMPKAEAAPRFMLWIDMLWVLGVCGLSLRNLGGWWMIRRLRERAAGPVPSEVQAAFARIRSALGVRKDVLLRMSDMVAGPVTVGALRAMVLLPLSALTSLGPDEIEVVLAHELAHVKRADFLWNLVQTVMETLFFFHPAVWWISGRVRHERELCCDDLALTVCPNPVVYASALYHLEEQRSRQMHLAMALDGHQSRHTLLMRIARILGDAPAGQRRAVRPVSMSAAVAGIAVLLLSAPQMVRSVHAMQAPATPVVKTAVDLAVKTDVDATTRAMISAETGGRVAAAAASAAQAPAKPQAGTPPKASEDERDAEPQQTTGPHTDYIDAMKAAGYDVDLDKLIEMKIQNVTPEYARQMAQLGFGKPTADQLVACKIHGVSPEAIAQMKAQGFEVKSLEDAISFKIFEVTPEFVAGMKAAGFDIDSKQAVALRVQGVTPDYARMIKQQYPSVTVDELIQTKIFKIDADFLAQAKRHGFENLSLKKLVELRISGIMDDEK